MEIVWKNHKIKKQVERMVKSNSVVKKRIKQLEKADCYLDIPSSSGKHFLKGNLKKYFAIDFDYPARLICEPIGEYKFEDGHFIKETITALEIIKIEKDYH